MKVLYVITRAEYGGGQVHVLDLLRGFRNRCEVALATGEEDYLTREAASLGVPVFVLPHLVHPIRPRDDVRAVRETLAVIRQWRPDLVHAHTSKAGIVGRAAARIAGVPSVFTAHTWAFAEGMGWKRRAVGIVAEKAMALPAARIINVSAANRDLALHYHIAPRRKLAVIHNGVPDGSERASPGNGGEPRIVMVARFAEQKDHGLLMRAFARAALPGRLQFIGDGPTRPLVETEARRLGIADRVDFLGARGDVPDVLAQAHIFALATNWEGFPLTILEAMRAGLPVVATAVGGVAEAIVDGVTGYTVPHADEAAFAARLATLLAEPQLRAQMGKAGRERYEQRFTLDIQIERTYQVYLAATRGAGATIHTPAADTRAA